MRTKLDQRASHEITHGRHLAEHGAERIWGWESPAGQVRAIRRSDLISKGACLTKEVHALELGCGTGNFTERFASTGATITGLDISSDLLEIAKRRGLEQPQVNFVEGRFEDCELQGNYDAIIGSSVLHHLEMETAVERIFSQLRPNGIMCFAEPNMLNPQVALQKNIPWLKARLGDSPYETAIISWKFSKLLRSAGFSNIKITPFDWLHPATPKSLIPFISCCGHVLESIPLIRHLSGSVLIQAQRPE